jgi:AraC family transcriptional regulator
MRNDKIQHDMCERFGLSSAPTLITSCLKAPITFSRLRRDSSGTRQSANVPREDAYAIHIALRAAGPCEIWMNGRKFGSDTVPEAATTLLTLDSGPSCCHSPIDSVRIHIPRLAVDEFADHAGLSRPRHLRAPFFNRTLDSTLFQLATATLPALETLEEVNSLFLEHMALAVLAHVHRTYFGGSIETQGFVGRLAPWQERRAKELMVARFDQRLLVAELAKECRLSSAHFARAFRQSTGLPPHRWLLAYRVEKAKALLLAGHTPLKDVASACGFADHSHLTRAFSRHVGQKPAAWRRTRMI